MTRTPPAGLGPGAFDGIDAPSDATTDAMPGAMPDAMRGIDWQAFDPSAHAPDLLERARRVWAERVQSEFRSLQIMNRFLTELTGAGEPVRFYGGAAELVADEGRHVALCGRLVQALGGAPRLPDEPRLLDPPEFLAAPMVQRALATALTMLVVDETMSVAYLRDLAARCRDPVVGAVLRAMVEDEDGHDAYGWDYVGWSLRRFGEGTLGRWRALVQGAVARHLTWADGVLGPDADLDRPLPEEPALADLGLFGEVRQALICRRTWRDLIGPRLVALRLQ